MASSSRSQVPPLLRCGVRPLTCCDHPWASICVPPQPGGSSLSWSLDPKSRPRSRTTRSVVNGGRWRRYVAHVRCDRAVHVGSVAAYVPVPSVHCMLFDMWAATVWDDADWEGAQTRGWTVMGRLRKRRERQFREAADARRRLANNRDISRFMTPAAAQREYEDMVKARWHGGPAVLAFLFAHPDSDAMRMLDARGDYFDVRSGDTWDLFFPGYYRSPRGRDFEQETGARPIGHGYGADWYFNFGDFNMLRQDIERSSERRWEYSGGTDLVLVNGWLFERGEPTVDWASTISGQITDRTDGTKTLTLANVIERITLITRGEGNRAIRESGIFPEVPMSSCR